MGHLKGGPRRRWLERIARPRAASAGTAETSTPRPGVNVSGRSGAHRNFWCAHASLRGRGRGMGEG
eukprot:7399194-Alexandrium_andersonii.AAC.1